MLKSVFTGGTGGGGRTATTTAEFLAFDTSTDQVPERLIDSGELPRFGSLNPTDGGSTRRLSLSGKWFNNGPQGRTQISAYAIDYRFALFSDFTYFLNNPVQGDQFEQTDRRRVFGLQATHGVHR